MATFESKGMSVVVSGVATVDDVKLFQLRNKKTEDGLRVSKIEVPSTVSSGARLIQFSPNGKWLCIVRPDSRILAARVVQEEGSFVLHRKLSKLRRIDREAPKIVLLGGLGRYDRTVSKIAFSTDSNVLVVSDLAGYMDSFVLSGEEDLSLDTPDVDEFGSASDSSDSESSSEDEEEIVIAPHKLIFGQQWLRNPSASSIPKLPSAPTIISFRPDSSAKNGHVNRVSPHPTRNNPHPISRALPTSATTPDRLFIMTACSSVFEFNVLSGSLTPWSRRNPSSILPEDFRRNRDHARGCFWNVTSEQARIWLYGVGWLWMFDLNVDFPLPNEATSTALVNGRAGSAIANGNLELGISRKIQKVAEGGKKQIREDIDINASPFDEMDLDTDAEGPTALERLRRGSSAGEARASGAKASWRTYKYRPILGVVVLGEEEGEAGLEVAIVERPIWEVELPPRYYGDQEWEKDGL
ncbi:putative U3 small nucleolar RNA-associated protein 4 [Glarea lozoyensis 74030]|uniref:Putative U3 small nucleolar RNA-associated protein 4 n=1 Tax=Glarea lozoyensis (strain ATCC 74030 / MF5533) TaxID=1104152 RepID=H0EHU3_GLAL7|nr:putative U3 small nucleolar RNA-associated protein 4 [Glarea lozoyensis 74030]